MNLIYILIININIIIIYIIRNLSHNCISDLPKEIENLTNIKIL